MKNVSNQFKDVIKAGGPFYAYANVKLSNNTQFTLDSEDDFYIDGNNYSESGGSGFPIGVAMSKQITLSLDNSDGRYSDYDFYGAVITLYTEADLPNGTVERIPEGIFTVIDSVAPGDVLEITAYDNMYKLDTEYQSNLTYPATTQQIWNNLCSTYDLLSGSTQFENNDFIVQSKPEGVTGRQMAGYIAQIACGNAVADTSGRLCIKSFDFSEFDTSEMIVAGEIETSSGCHILSEFSQDPDIGTDDVTITGVMTTIEAENSDEEDQTIIYGTSDYALSIDNPLITGSEQTAISLIGERVTGLTIRPFSGDFSPNPRIEFADLAYLVDRKDNVYKTIITSNDFNYLASSSLENGLESPERNRSVYSGNATEVYRKTQEAIRKSRTEWEKAAENLNNQIKNSSGLYPTEEEQPDGSTIYYFHNKPTLEESSTIIKITAQALAISTDGGKTYPTGITVDGNAIVSILDTIGVNASWINTGVLNISDEDGNEIMYVDVDTGVVRINAQSLTISGSPVASEQYVQDQVAKLGTLNIILSNDYCSVPVTSDGTIVTGGLSGVDTVVTVLYGTTDITDRAQVTITESAGIDGTWSAANKKYTVSSVTTDNAWADFSVTYQGINVVKRFTVAKLYPGADGEPGKNYQLGSSAVTVRRGKYGVLSPTYVDFTSYYFSGDAVRQPYSGRFAIEESVDGMSWTSRYTSEEDEDAVRCHFYSPMVTSAGLYLSDAQGRFLAALELPEDVIAIRCTLYAAGGTANIIDRQTVSIITDAKSLSAEEYFNLLTDNGRIQGIFMRGDQLFINGEYVQTKGLKAVNQQGQTTFYIDDQGNVTINAQSLSIAGLVAATQQYAAGQASQALADSESYADSVGKNVNNSINQEEIFNRLFANGAVQGISMQKIGSQYYLYINAEYINSGELVGRTIRNENSTLVISYDGSVTSKVLDGGKSGILEDGYLKMQHQDISNLPTSREGISVENPNFMSHLTAHSIFFFKKSGNAWSTNGGFYADVYDNDFTCYLDAEFFGNVTGVSSYTLQAETDNYATKLKYAAQTASPYISDIGQGITDSSGECYVSIDDIFSETVDQDCEYQVFLQKEGQGDIWVDSKEPTFFIVKGTPNLKFSWELKAKQKGYANERLETYGLSDHENDIDYESFYGSEVEKYFKEQEEMYSEEINQLYVS